MLRLVREVFHLLSPAQRRQLYRLQALVVARTFAEIAAVAAVGPFMLLVSDPGRISSNRTLAWLYQASGLGNPTSFLVALGVGAFAVLAASSALSIFTTYTLHLHSNRVGAQLGERLFRYYLTRPWLFHAQHNSANLTKRISVEASRVTKGVLSPLMQLNASALLAFFLAAAIFALDPVGSLIGVSLLSGAYFATYVTVRKRIARNGKRVTQANSRHFKLMSEGFGGIREILLRGAQDNYVRHFRETGEVLAEAQGRNSALSQTPRYLIELAALGTMIFFVVYVVRAYQGDASLLLPLLSIYGMAALKLLPAFQGIYSSLATVKGAQAAFDSIKGDLAASLSADATVPPQADATVVVASGIELQAVGFAYPGKDAPTLRGLDMLIPARSLVGMVGVSGSGKSTLIDIVTGLVPPDSGRMLVDGRELHGESLRAWQRSLGLVSQSIYLMDASIAENIAFTTPGQPIDAARVEEAIRLASLDELVRTLPDGLDTRVGERGIQLSGGQRQRIGIARALYHRASVLILDEATNALDSVTEKQIMDGVLALSRDRIVLVVAHRLRTVRRCDIVYFLEHGRIVDQGTYDELVGRNAAFRNLALHSEGPG